MHAGADSEALEKLGIVAVIAYEIAGWATFAKLTFFDDYVYNWWNWIIALPVNMFLGQIWPIYWLIIYPIFHK
jgi:hypothetical protein